MHAAQMRRTKQGIALAAWLAVGLWACVFHGCSHYHLGRPNGPGFHTLFIEPVRNATYAPQAQALVGQAVANAFAREGTVVISSKEDADAIMSINITGFDRVASSFQESDTMQAQAYEVALTANVTITDTRTKKTYLDNVSIKTSTQVYVNSGYIQAEYEAVPILARDLGTKIVNRTLSVW